MKFLLRVYLHLPQINRSHLRSLQGEVFRVSILGKPHGQARGTFPGTRGGILSESSRPRSELESKGRIKMLRTYGALLRKDHCDTRTQNDREL